MDMAQKCLDPNKLGHVHFGPFFAKHPIYYSTEKNCQMYFNMVLNFDIMSQFFVSANLKFFLLCPV